MAASASSSSPSSETKKSLKSISESIGQIESKKALLKKAFDDLDSNHRSFLAAFSLPWSHLDSHFSAAKASMESQFRHLQALANPPEPSPRPELAALCESGDGLGLRNFVIRTASERAAVRAELPAAVRKSPDAAAMVLDAMAGFYDLGSRDWEVSSVRRCCVLLLEVAMAAGVGVGEEVRERAKGVAAEWRGKMSVDEESPLEALGFLHLVAAFGLGPEFVDGDIVDCFVAVAKYRQAMELCQRIGLGDKVGDVIEKLVSKGKQVLATKFCFEFELTEKFPPVPLLKAYVKEAKRIAKQVCKDGDDSLKAQNEATAKELSALRLVLKVVEEHKLESDYPRELLDKRIEELEKQRVDRKRPPQNNHSSKPSHTQHQPPKHQNGKKRPRVDASAGRRSPARKNFRAGNFSAPPYPQSYLQMTGRSADGSALYASSPAAPYGTPGLIPSAGIYGVPGNSSSQYNAEPYTPSSYYDRPAYGGYGLPSQQYPPAYRPQ